VPEGALLGVGDGRYLAMCYVPAAAVTMLQLLHSHVRGLGLRGVWFALALYYFTLMVLFCARWYGGNYVQQRAGKNNAAPAPADSWTDTEPLDDDHLPAAAA
jgi:Na+-driven multidrug efflux pump